jgi:hypothetical protein
MTGLEVNVITAVACGRPKVKPPKIVTALTMDGAVRTDERNIEGRLTLVSGSDIKVPRAILRGGGNGMVQGGRVCNMALDASSGDTTWFGEPRLQLAGADGALTLHPSLPGNVMH